MFYFSHYDLFLQKNKFTALEPPRNDVADLAKREGHLRYALLCLGAMQALKLSEPSMGRWFHQFALKSYAKSISGLRRALVDMPVHDVEARASILWTTLLLGLFEVNAPILPRETYANHVTANE